SKRDWSSDVCSSDLTFGMVKVKNINLLSCSSLKVTYFEIVSIMKPTFFDFLQLHIGQYRFPHPFNRYNACVSNSPSATKCKNEAQFLILKYVVIETYFSINGGNS